MRITCPNCGAEYEVPADAIPAVGRDVLCSACGHTWFQRPDTAAADPDPLDLVPQVEDDDEEADDLAELEATPLPQPGGLPHSSVSSDVAQILRAEAAAEAKARAEEAARQAIPVPDPTAALQAPPPVPPSLPVSQAASPADPGPPRPTLIREVPARPLRRSESEVDPDKINFTLRSTLDRPDARGGAGPARRSGFAAGFAVSLLALAILAGVYAAAPGLSAAMPAMAQALGSYVAAVDRGRDWLDRQAGRAMPSRAAESPAP
ncbi:zinc-ribbon domain-containing protein [Rubellimicrobium arenae]|uniref:zinc-ribbon domain-containing protein n=1 Tax=Rubellimicrobium arenae TaxID=2817372 RepID=UPI001B3008A2|nr:zinc-ribbon domain-containing protein [Rubellimicrobium arenae]